ncbi:MAG: EVE domain-containing protein [Acidobacteria bacterium]|nr:EVE domain-containing protein [Acidobacteriota bacterium]
MPRYWLFKTEPSEYSFADLEREQKAIWNGVSNNLALKNLREVRLGDQVLIYHTGEEKAIVGLAEAISDAFPDPQENDDKLFVVKLKPKRKFDRAVSLAEIKAAEGLTDFDLVRLPRLSVMPISPDHWRVLQDLLK